MSLHSFENGSRHHHKHFLWKTEFWIANIRVNYRCVCWIQIKSSVGWWIEIRLGWISIDARKAVSVWYVIWAHDIAESHIASCYHVSIIYFIKLVCIHRDVIGSIIIISLVNYVGTAVSNWALTGWCACLTCCTVLAGWTVCLGYCGEYTLWNI